MTPLKKLLNINRALQQMLETTPGSRVTEIGENVSEAKSEDLIAQDKTDERPSNSEPVEK